MAGADIRRFSTDRGGASASFALGVVHGALLTLADTILYPSIVLVFFVAQLTDDLTRIALVPVIGTTAWLLSRLLAGSIASPRRRQLPWATGAAMVQAAAVVLLAYVGYQTDAGDDERLRSFYLCYVAYIVAAGGARAPSSALIERAIAPDRRGQFLTQRTLWGAVLALAGGLAAREVLGPAGPGFPKNFAQLFAVAAAAATAAAFFQLRLREPAKVGFTAASDQRVSARGILDVLADLNFRRYAAFRILLTATTLADPFFILYARRELNVPTHYLGIYLLSFTAARLVSWPVWAWVGQRGGDRSILQGTAIVRLVAPLAALLLPYLADSSLYQDRFDNSRPMFFLFGLVFAAIGASTAGQARANHGYLHDIAPPRSHPAYAAAVNAVVAIAATAPLAGAWLLERYNYDVLLAAAAIAGVVAIFFSGALPETHTRARPVPRAWRPRGARSARRAFRP